MPRYYTCCGQAEHRSFSGAAVALQSDFTRHGSSIVSASGNGFWAALWLAEQYDVRLLILEMRTPPEKSVFRAHALRNLFAIICPVLVFGPAFDSLPDLPNARIFHMPKDADRTSLIHRFANEL